MKYYFSKGVDRAFIIDNNSTDDTLAFLASQKNTHVFHTKEGFKGKERWLRIILDQYGQGNWCIIADADEILSYPGIDRLSIKDLCSFLDNEGHTGMQCFFLDMYSNKPIGLTHYDKAADPFSVCPYFDGEGYTTLTKKMPRNYDNKDYSHYQVIIGGMRKRVFGIEEVGVSKVPIFKYSDKIITSLGHHFIYGASLSDLNGVVFHFKYFSDFSSKVKQAAVRGEYWNKGFEYKKYQVKLEENPALNLFNSNSIKYKNTAQLIRLGLMKTSDKWEKFAK